MQTNTDNITAAKQWRDQRGYTERGGVVILCDGEVQGWVNILRNPEHWRPGCIAVDDLDQIWITTGGDEWYGAREWQPIKP